MSRVRALVRAFSLVIVTVVMYALLECGALFVWLFNKPTSAWRAGVFCNWARAVSAILHITVEATGPKPQAPFFLVSNHLSYVDVFVFGSLLDCVFVARGDVADWPLIGRLCRAVGTIFIDRERRADVARVNNLIDDALKSGRGVVLFAEGTSTGGDRVLPFKSSLLEQAARAGLEVHFASLSYHTSDADPPAELSVCWWGDMTFLKHAIGLLHLKQVHAAVRFGSTTVRDRDRKALASRLWQAVTSQFTPVAPVEESQARNAARV